MSYLIRHNNDYDTSGVSVDVRHWLLFLSMLLVIIQSQLHEWHWWKETERNGVVSNDRRILYSQQPDYLLETSISHGCFVMVVKKPIHHSHHTMRLFPPHLLRLNCEECQARASKLRRLTPAKKSIQIKGVQLNIQSIMRRKPTQSVQNKSVFNLRWKTRWLCDTTVVASHPNVPPWLVWADVELL